MSRSDYNYDVIQWDLVRWRGAVASAIRGTRGQELLREMLAALDAMPTKALIVDELENAHGEVCALGCVGTARGLAMGPIDSYNHEDLARLFGVAPALTREVMFKNDECGFGETPEQRWVRMRAWVAEMTTLERGEAAAS